MSFNAVSSRLASSVPPWALALAAIVILEVANAFAITPIEQMGAAATAWLRMCFGGLFLLLLVRPSVKLLTRETIPTVLMLGIVIGLENTLFMFAIDRIPLGTAVAIEFLGPLTLAGIMSKHLRGLIWPALALIGVTLLTEPWVGKIDMVGVIFALGGALFWALYNVFTQRAGDQLSGITGLAFAIPVAAVVTSPLGVTDVTQNQFNPWLILMVAGIALMTPVISFGLEMLALHRMTHTAFGTLLSVDPAVSLIVGLLLLAQVPNAIQIVGIVIVVFAGIGAQRGGLRAEQDPKAIAGSEAPPIREHI